MKASIKKSITKTVCAAAAAMLLCTSCGDVGEQPAPKVKISAQPISSEAPSSEPGEQGSSAAAASSDTERPLEAPSRETLAAFADFSAGILNADCAEKIKAGENVLLSPESLLMALGMTSHGACGETGEQMRKVLANGADNDTIAQGMRYLSHHIPETAGVKMNIANSVWSKQCPDYTLKRGFAELMREYYDADTFCVPFNEQTLNDINGWVSNNTNGMIPSILSDMDPDAVTYLINAIAFEAEWDKQYDKSQVRETATFTNSSGETEKCTMLFSEEAHYMSDGRAEAFYKLYKGGKYAFMGILPNSDISVSDYIAGLGGESWYALVDSCNSEDVEVLIPEFTYDYDCELSSALKAMGMELPFSPMADFGNMADHEHESLYISRVLHKTHIEVDRKGTKAAAATAVEMKCEDAVMSEEPKRICLDRPFVYAIVDYETGFPIFLGAVNTTAKETAQK